MQQADTNTPGTMVRPMNEIFSDMIYKDLIIYIDDIIISSWNYHQHIEALRKVLYHLPAQQFWLKDSKCHLFNKGLAILGDILTSEGLSMDSRKIQKIFNFPEPTDKRQLQAFIAIVNFSSKFPSNLATTATILTDLQSTSITWKCIDTPSEAFDPCKALITNK